MTMVALPFVGDLSVRLVIVQNLTVVYAFWLPMLVIKRSFKEMDNMLETFCFLVC